MATSNNNIKEVYSPRKAIKRNQELHNPCFKEYNISLKCMEANMYNHNTCELCFENYRVCKKFWGKVIASRRYDNITPFIPLPEDRERVKAEYLRSHKFP